MTGEALYERYKDALKRGHVASMRGHLEEALTAYAEAAAIAPERATPHTSAGTALMRRRRPADALRHYTAALSLSPGDEAALLGRAQALTALDRRPEAADAYDTLAEVRASTGKLADAVDAARRGLELAEGRERRRTLHRLIERLRESEPGEPGRESLEAALQVLDGMAVTAPFAAPSDAPVVEPGPAPTAAAGDATPDAPADAGAGMGGDAGALEAAAADEPLPATPIRAALDRDLPDGATPATLGEAADAAIEAGADGDGVARLLDLAAAHWRDGRTDAALDACYLALSLDPDDVGLHLALVQLYDDHGWSQLAAEKLDLLDRIAGLDDDGDAVLRVAAARSARG